MSDAPLSPLSQTGEGSHSSKTSSEEKEEGMKLVATRAAEEQDGKDGTDEDDINMAAQWPDELAALLAKLNGLTKLIQSNEPLYPTPSSSPQSAAETELLALSPEARALAQMTTPELSYYRLWKTQGASALPKVDIYTHKLDTSILSTAKGAQASWARKLEAMRRIYGNDNLELEHVNYYMSRPQPPRTRIRKVHGAVLIKAVARIIVFEQEAEMKQKEEEGEGGRKKALEKEVQKITTEFNEVMRRQKEKSKEVATRLAELRALVAATDTPAPS